MTRKLKEFVNHQSLTEIDAPAAQCADDHIVILMAHFNGAKTLGDQLDSIARQDHKNWSLIISDDGSADEWQTTWNTFAACHKGLVHQIRGPKQGSAQNFFNLIRHAGPMVAFAALCDQDDYWLSSKLTRAMYVLQDVPHTTPGLYVAPTFICDQDLTPMRRSKKFRRPPSFANALVQSIGGGNTMILNRAALDLVQETARHAVDVVAHDWWIYQIITGAGGVIKYDQCPLVLYRQHDHNQVGANDTLGAGFLRIKQLLAGRYRHWNSKNCTALEAANHWLTPDARQTLAHFQSARFSSHFWTRLLALKHATLYRQTFRGQVALWTSALLKKL